MTKAIKHDVIKAVCKQYNIKILLMAAGRDNALGKPFLIVYVPNQKEQKFLSTFYFNNPLREIYQLINVLRIANYKKFVKNLSAREEVVIKVFK